MSPRNSAFNFYVGREPRTGRNVFIGNRHFLCGAQNMAGKGSGLIVPVLQPGGVGYAGSMLCTDPNLENANITAGPCQDAGFEAFVMDPYGHAQGRAGRLRAKWNLLDEIDLESREIKEVLWKIAEGCIASPRNHSDNAAFFVSGARELWMGAIAHILSTETDPLKRTLPFIRMRLEIEGAEFFKEMEKNFAVDGLPASAAKRLHTGGNEAGGYLTTLREETRWLSSKVMQEHLAPSPGERVWRTEWLHSRKTRVYLGLPGAYTSFQQNWIRLFVNWTLTVLSQHKDRPTATGLVPTLCLDEFGSALGGPLEYIDRHLGELRHYCRLAIFVQGLDQIKKDYPHSYEGFLQNSEKLFFGIEDLITAKYLSEALGERVWYEANPSVNFGKRGDDATGSNGASRARYTERFMKPEEIMRFLAPETRRMLLLSRPHPTVLERIPYWEMKDATFDPNPKHAAQNGLKHTASAPTAINQLQRLVQRWL